MIVELWYLELAVLTIPINPDFLTREAVSPDEFREAMSRVGSAVHIVTTDGIAGRAGLTAADHTQRLALLQPRYHCGVQNDPGSERMSYDQPQSSCNKPVPRRRTDTPDEEKRSWSVSNPHARRSVFYPSTIRPRPSFVQSATAFAQLPTNNLGLAPLVCGTTMRPKWVPER